MKQLMLIVLSVVLISNICNGQNWTSWEDVQNSGVQVSFLYPTHKGGASLIRFRNNSQSSFCLVTVEFEVLSDGQIHKVPMTAYKLAPNGGIDANKGKSFYTDNNVINNMRLVRLEDGNCKSILGNVSHDNGVNEIAFEKKKTQEQISQEKEQKVKADRMKTLQEQEKQKQEQIKKQNDEAAKYKQEQIEKQQERQRQKTVREDALKKKVESDKLENDNLSKTLNNSIEDAFNIIKENLNKTQKEVENNTQPIENKDPNNLSPAELFEKGNYAEYTEKNMSSAIYWYTQSANSGYGKAMGKLANYYINEETANYDLAIDWWLLAYRNKNVQLDVLDKITTAYGNTYQPKDYSNIFQFYKIILQNEVICQFLKDKGSYMWATYNLANFYYIGNGGQQIFSQAFSLHKKNSEDGFVPSMIVLGILYRDGAGTTKDYNEAIKWWSKVVEIAGTRVSNWAMFLLGEMYEKGLGVEKDSEKAKEWYIKSSNAGFQGAKTKLESLRN